MRPSMVHCQVPPGMSMSKNPYPPSLNGVQFTPGFNVTQSHLQQSAFTSQSLAETMMGVVRSGMIPAGFVPHPAPQPLPYPHHQPPQMTSTNPVSPRLMPMHPAPCRLPRTPVGPGHLSSIGPQVSAFPPQPPRPASSAPKDPRLISPAASSATVPQADSSSKAAFSGGARFSQEDVDMVLYGYARSHSNGKSAPGHALSGLRVGQLSYGIDRILGKQVKGGNCADTPAVVTSACNSPRLVVDPANIDLPDGLELHQTTFANAVHYGIFCKKTVVPRGTRFGPFNGRHVNASEVKSSDDNSLMWEVFREGKLSHFIDGRGAGNWMAFVNCARYAQEQNLLAVQLDGAIYYEACKDIPQGTELLVWYGDCYLQFMGIPIALKETSNAHSQDELENSEGYQCERCGKVFAYKYYRDKHLKYTRCVDMGDRKFPCHICSRSFEKRDRLRIHILHVHERHRPHKCTVCGKSFSQSSSLNKHMRVHSGERPYKCVYCSKAFTASSILRTHIRQHSGEKPFKCKHCGKAFASHAAHDSHVRRTHAKERSIICNVCGKTFSQTYELRFHLRTHGASANSDGDFNKREALCPTPADGDVVDVAAVDLSDTACLM